MALASDAHRGDNAAGRLIEPLQAYRTRRQLPLIGGGLCTPWLQGLLRRLLRWGVSRPAATDLNVFHVDQAARDLRLQRRELRVS